MVFRSNGPQTLSCKSDKEILFTLLDFGRTISGRSPPRHAEAHV